MSNTNMKPTTSSAGGDSSQLLEPKDLELSSKGMPSTLCGTILNTARIRSGVKDTVIGGVICINHSFYAMTSARSLANAQHSYEVQFKSDRLDWALCEVTDRLAVPNAYDSGPLLRYMQEDELEHTTGPVEVLDGYSPCKANLIPDGYTTMSRFGHDAKLRPIFTTLHKETIFRTGAWVVKDDALCGYVVHSEPQLKGSSTLGYFIPIWQAFKEIEATTGKKIVFGQELHDMMGRL